VAKHSVRWSSRPEEQDFGAALNYLSLQFPTAIARRLVQKARRTPPVQHIAKDVLRASNLPLLPTDERHVAQDLKRIHKGKRLSPIILVQGDLTRGRPFVIADGYHRMCAACHANEDAPVSAVVVKP
jgi:hypothetical protein